MLAGKLVSVEAARMPILCLSDCRSLYDHLNKQGVPRVPTDKRLAVDLAALRQGLRSEMWSDELPIGWLPGSAQRADVLTKPQNPTDWWETADQKILLPLAIGQRGGLVCDRQTTQRTSVKLERSSGIRVGSLFPYEYEHTGSRPKLAQECTSPEGILQEADEKVSTSTSRPGGISRRPPVAT